MQHLTRTLALVAIVVGTVLGTGGYVALAQSTTQSAQRSAGGTRSTSSVVTPPPLPFGDQSRTPQGGRRSVDVSRGSSELAALARLPESQRFVSKLVGYRGPRPPIPKMSQLLSHKARWKMSASGGSIVLTGTSSVPYLDDQTLSYGANVYWLCQNLQPNTTYRYLLFPPDGSAYTVQTRDYTAGAYVPSFQTDAQGRCEKTNGTGQQVPFYAQLSLQTPLAASPDPIGGIGVTNRAPGPPFDVPYSGVWTIAVQNYTGGVAGAYEAVAYSVVLGTLNFSTFSDPGYSVKANDYSSGSTVYVSASGLNATHFYAFGFVNSSGNGLPCVGVIPAGSQNWNNGTCFTTGTTGILPTNQTLTGQYTTPANGGNSVGTQTVQLYDATTNDLISTQQISLNPSSVTWAPLVPYNSLLGNGTNLNDIFATDGILGTPGGGGTAEQSVTGLNYNITAGLVNGHSYRITVSNANGVVLASTTTDTNPRFGSPQFFTPQAPFTAAGTSSGNQQVAFPVNTTNFTSFGATQIPFAPSVYTAQVYDITAGTVVGSKSFTIASYASTLQWTNPAGSYVNVNPGGAATNVTATIRNTAGTLYGNWNGDPIKALTIRSDSANVVSLNLQAAQVGCVPAAQVCAFDSAGKQWNITRVSAQQLNLVPAVAGQSLAANATLPVPFTVAAPAGSCTTVCLLQTQITPLHGIAPSGYNATMTNTATNGLAVFGNGVVGTNTEATFSWQVGAYATGTQLGTPRYKQMMYRSGTHAAPANPGYPPTSYYPLTINVTNNGPRTIYYFEFVMPATVDPNVLTPTITSATVNGVNQTANYAVYTQNGTNGSTSDATNLGPNAFALVATAKAAGLPTGKTATFVIKMPILLSAFPFQEIAATANYNDLNGYGAGAPFSMAPTNVLSNAIAGTQNVDSTELGVFSLDPTLMSATITPVVVPSLANQNWSFKFINTSTGLDPNPDYISEFLISVPAAGGANYPTVTSVTASNGATWNATPTGTSGQWLLSLCAVAVAPNPATQASTACPAATDASSLPPGGTLTINFNYAAAPAVGNYPINWTVVGANGGGVVPAAGGQIPTLVVANTTAQTSFTFAGGYTASPSYPPGAPIQSVPFGSQPIIGAWSNFTYGNGFVYELYNNGSTTITDVSIAIPWANTSGQLIDSANPWKVDAATAFVYGPGAAGPKCSGNGINSLTQAVNGAPGTSGLLRLSGCNLAVGQKLDIYLNMRDPYDVNSTFRFDASVATGNATPPDPRVAGNPNTLANYSLANTVRIVSDTRLAIQIPTGAWPASAYVPGLFGGSSPTAIGCPSCTYSTAGTYPLINLNNINGTVNVNDALAASVYSDDANGWSLSVTADVNPGTSSGQLSTNVDAAHSSPTAGLTVLQGALATVPTGGTQLQLSSFAGAVQKAPVDNIMSYRVTVNPLSVNNNATTTVTLTYTLVAN